jgi:hypothetical protein
VCGPFNTQKESTIDVLHARIQPKLPYYIEPNTGEDWEAVVVWASDAQTAACECIETSHTVNFTVDWNAGLGTFVATCTSGCSPTGPVKGVDICYIEGCDLQSADPHGWLYRARLRIEQTVPICTNRLAYLERVEYTTTDVDDGRGIVDDCDLGNTYSPTSQTFTVTDYGVYTALGTFVCWQSCDQGTPVTITYQ